MVADEAREAREAEGRSEGLIGTRPTTQINLCSWKNLPHLWRIGTGLGKIHPAVIVSKVAANALLNRAQGGGLEPSRPPVPLKV